MAKLATSTAKRHTPKTHTWRPTAEDRAIMNRLAAKYGLKDSQIIKMALRALAAKEAKAA